MLNLIENYTATKTLKFTTSSVNVKLFQVVWRGRMVTGTWNSVARMVEARPVWLEPEEVEELENFLDGVDN
jgi:hypothetical protein